MDWEVNVNATCPVPALLNTATSAVPGTAPELQLVPVPHVASVVPFGSVSTLGSNIRADETCAGQQCGLQDAGC